MKIFSCISLCVILISINVSGQSQDGVIVVEMCEGDSILNIESPLYDGRPCEESFTDYVKTNLIYPKEFAEAAIQGRITVTFYIEKDSTLTNAEVIHSLHPLLDAEALRVINTAPPKWTPGKINDEPGRIQLRLPILFQMKH